MKKHLLFLILCLMGILTSCSQKHTRYYIGVSQCSDDEWRHKMNHEIVREALFYDGVEVEIRTAKPRLPLPVQTGHVTIFQCPAQVPYPYARQTAAFYRGALL